MGFFAKIDENNIVLDVLSLPEESDEHYLEYLTIVLGLDGSWVPATPTSFAANQAHTGHQYFPDLNIFIAPKPFSSWVLKNTNNGYYYWTAPVPYPNDDNSYVWNEDTVSWDLFEE